MSETWKISVHSDDPRFFYFTLEDTESGERVANIYHANMERAHLIKAAPKMRDALTELVSIVGIHSQATGKNFAWAEISEACKVLAEANGETE